ncbi:ABC transporter family protein [Tritrichomonas foetus]|uniref:ABC transporter family protein n=1 Tax=Tritrichomonas foetus TaxID=1144522 RepID=A0A1J4JXV4_9EUKA|nr:ABC transporter family protein [Tritrichomonas foetus]|eukprot:OHT03514.1 ABC transporter family protein [Tritrichomonas foetus]
MTSSTSTTEGEIAIDGNPLGSWSDLKPSFNRQVRALFKKQFLIKIRHAASIIEVIVALALVFVMYPVHILAKTEYDPIEDPEVEPLTINGSSLFMFFAITENPKFSLLPDNEMTHQLWEHMTILKIISKGINMSFGNMSIDIKPFTPKYYNDKIKMEDEIYVTDDNGLGIFWANSDKEDALIRPDFEIYHQTMGPSIEQDIFLELKEAVAKMALEKQGITGMLQYTNPLVHTGGFSVGFSFQQFARPKLVQRFSMVSLCMGFFSCLPILLASRPDMETVLGEKDSHVAALCLLMGMSETAYWFVNFFTPFILCFFVYLVAACIYVFWFGLVGSDFTLILVTSILFIVAQLWFQFFISTFIKKGSSGRAMTVVLIVFILFFSYLHIFLTLDEDNSSDALRHIFCILPFSAYELFMMQDYITCSEGVAPFRWNNLNDRSYICPPYIPLFWLVIDIVLYFFLFLLFNACNPREFGTPIIKWSEFFSKAAWKRAFSHASSLKVAPKTDEFMAVRDLSKVFHGDKDITALTDVDFEIKTGEIIVMIGPNGAGKSTLINVISGAIEPSKGVLRLLGGEETTRFKEVQSYLGVCFQDNVIINLLSVREHFELFGAMRGVPLQTLQDCIDYFATNMQLTHMLNNRAGDLSGGQKRKLCIGLSLLGNPPVVLMDEPTAGVDVQARQLIWKMISNLKETTSIITSHALEEAEAVSSRLFIVAGGKIPFCGTSTELRNKFKCGYLLRVERDDGKVGPVLEFAQSFIPEAHLVEDRDDMISMPVDPAIPRFLEALSEKEAEYGIRSYSFSVEQLEDMLLKLIQSEEVNQQNH